MGTNPSLIRVVTDVTFRSSAEGQVELGSVLSRQADEKYSWARCKSHSYAHGPQARSTTVAQANA